MKIPAVFVSFRDGHGIVPIVAVQDSFGSLYRRFKGCAPQAGAILSTRNIGVVGAKRQSMRDDGMSIINVRVLGGADISDVRRLIRLAGYDARRMARDGNWYECISD